MDDTLSPPPATAPLSAAPKDLPLISWVREGLRAGLFMRPRVEGHSPGPLHIALLVLLVCVLEIGLSRWEIAGAAEFDLRAWLSPWWSSAAVLLLAWWVLPPAAHTAPARPAGLPAWFALWLYAVLPAGLLSQALGIAQAHDALPELLDTSAGFAWGLYFLLWGWTIAAVLGLFVRFGAHRARIGVAGIVLLGLFALTTWQFSDRPWRADMSAELLEQQQRPRLQLSQEVFETQQALWQRQVQALAPERPGVVDVYGLVFSPYADEDVFLREGTMVSSVLTERFDAQGRVLHLVNHPSTAASHPWATTTNLERAIDAMAERMDREHDVLVVYLTSHGARDFRLSASHGPLTVEPLSPGDLRRALDKSGIRHRVAVVSACYSGGWVGPLASETTLVMTAADPDRTSYGCGRLSELTFFGRAVFNEALRKTRSFEKAFAAAVPVIRLRETEAGKDDGFSNPQISVGEKIRPVLLDLEQRLDGPAKQPG